MPLCHHRSVEGAVDLHVIPSIRPTILPLLGLSGAASILDLLISIVGADLRGRVYEVLTSLPLVLAHQKFALGVVDVGVSLVEQARCCFGDGVNGLASELLRLCFLRLAVGLIDDHLVLALVLDPRLLLLLLWLHAI